MFQHCLHCYKLFEQDRKYLKHVYELRYEDYVENPDKYHQEIAAFIGTRVPEPPKEDTFRIVLAAVESIGFVCSRTRDGNPKRSLQQEVL